jgi:NTE family protein
LGKAYSEGVSSMDTALVLSGGGARGAYQAGVLLGLLDCGLIPPERSPFDILVGTSAGSIHTTALAAYADRPGRAIMELADVWSKIRARDVFRTDLAWTVLNALRWARDLGFGGLLGGVRPKALLDTSPLPGMLRNIPFPRIAANIEHGLLKALAIPVTEYFSNESVIFLQSHPSTEVWRKQRARVERTDIAIEHILASSAIPMLFPTVELGGRHFGDGCLRNTTPLGPAIRLGANRILAIGVQEPSGVAQCRTPMVADVASTMLDAIMMDAMEKDVAHCQRITASLKGAPSEGFRPVEVMWLAPTQPIAPIARELMHRVPPLIRYLLRGLGGDAAVSELASYLLFHPDYCGRLLDLGARQVHRDRDAIARFLEGGR